MSIKLPALFGNNKKEEIQSPTLDPFALKHITRISMCMRHPLFEKEAWAFEATIYFKNGDTSGEQNIKGTDFMDLFQKVYAFCEKLKIV